MASLFAPFQEGQQLSLIHCDHFLLLLNNHHFFILSSFVTLKVVQPFANPLRLGGVRVLHCIALILAKQHLFECGFPPLLLILPLQILILQFLHCFISMSSVVQHLA